MVTQVKPGYSFVSNAVKNDSCHKPVLTKELILNGRIMKSLSFSEEDTSRLLLRLTINMNCQINILCSNRSAISAIWERLLLCLNRYCR